MSGFFDTFIMPFVTTINAQLTIKVIGWANALSIMASHAPIIVFAPHRWQHFWHVGRRFTKQ